MTPQELRQPAEPALFIAEAAAVTLNYDLIRYSDDCNKRYAEDFNRCQFNWQCRRYLAFIGLIAGPFCGFMT